MVLGMTNDRNTAAKAVESLGESIRYGVVPAPTSLDAWAHDTPRDLFLILADRNGVEINVREGKESGHRAYASIKLGPEGTADLQVTYYVFCNAVGEADRKLYDQHNRECALEKARYCEPIALIPTGPCADGKCPDPIAHTEGFHDL